ncbi:hypothetical protein AGDE_14212 [Angomonas deanei]|uniref:Uncharacterized protein n=1 Tax=Angomonas deanei TaxID=59799 RepID=A0A7G2CMI3_9TRYP|nr:hypothetical protein AGDE_14212 [Angomonas deanei]CAD2221046.1 hypothetical protein, conserved [Angomonas deanei]|eukprot:EPY21214.1 hypothetical protein AGDE_14212 [Angomonas deanei]
MQETLETLEKALEEERQKDAKKGGSPPPEEKTARGTVPTLMDAADHTLQSENGELRNQLQKAEEVLDSIEGSLVKNAETLKGQSKETDEALKKLKSYKKNKEL